MDASGAVLTFTYSIVSLVEILRAKRAMVKRSAKAHFFFLNMGCLSIEIERNHLAIQSMKKIQRKRGWAPLPRLRFTKDASSLAANFFRPGV